MSKRTSSANYEWNGADEGQKKQRQDGDRVRLLVLGRYAGSLIGKGGENFKSLREQYTDVKITGLNSRSNERTLQLVGPRADTLEIVKGLLPKCPDARYSPSKNKCTFELNILADTTRVGAIIGKKGLRMKEIVDETGIKLKVYPECLPNSTERVVAIGADDEETVMKGLETVLNIIDSVSGPHHTTFWDPENGSANDLANNILSMPTNMGNVNTNTSMGMSLGNMNVMGQNTMGASSVDEKNVAAILVQQRQLREQSGIDLSKDFGSVETVTTLTLSNELCGVVIGQGGTNIKYIKQVSGAKVQTSRSEKGSDEKRTITLTGTQDQIQVAEQLMAQCIRAGKRQPPQQQQQKMGQSLPVKLPWGGAQGRGRFMVS